MPGRNTQLDKEKRRAEPPDPAGFAERIPGPREPRQHPQQNTATGTEPRPDAEPAADPEPEDWELEPDDAADTDAGPESEKGAAGPDAANDSNNQLDLHDGCTKCGGGGSARILRLRGEPLSVATIRRM
ncbi:hypothetical protein ACWDWO_05605, partial [Actinopolymorpha singaporensis]